MRLLLDPHILLWWDANLSRLSEAQDEAIADSQNDVFVSAVTAWELGIKHSLGKLNLTTSIRALVHRFGFIELSITALHGEIAAELPFHHKDPFDRMLIEQATSEEMVLVSRDARLANYTNLNMLQ